jgi:hypothetical protein
MRAETASGFRRSRVLAALRTRQPERVNALALALLADPLSVLEIAETAPRAVAKLGLRAGTRTGAG